MTSSSSRNERLSLKTKLCFGVGNFSVLIGKLAPKQLSLPIYNDALGVSSAAIGTTLAVTRIADAAIDTLMGHISDRTVSRWGRRRPYIFVGALLTGLFFAAIWLFPRGFSPHFYIIYFAATSALFYLALTVFSVPWYALGYELPPNYDERTRLQSFSNAFGLLAQIAVAWFYAATQVKFFPDIFVGIRVVGLVAGALLIGVGLIPALLIRESSKSYRLGPVYYRELRDISQASGTHSNVRPSGSWLQDSPPYSSAPPSSTATVFM